MEIKNYKLDFLKDYLEKQKITEIPDAFSLLDEYFETLPQQAKTKTRELGYCQLADAFHEALDEQLKVLASCPFVKIVIDKQGEDEQDKKVLDWCKKSLLCLEGYVDGLGGDVRRIKQQLENQQKEQIV